MRLGQLARKYDVSAQQIVNYLGEVAPELNDLHPNTKLDVATENLVASKFGKREETVEESAAQDVDDTPEVPATDSQEVQPARVDEQQHDVEVDDVSNEKTAESEDIEVAPVQEEKVILTDRLLEILESEELPDEIHEITHIKAPKKELEGLKVLGKIELEEPKPKSKEKEEQEESDDKNNSTRSRKKGNQNGRLSPEEVERRRKRAKKKKEDFLKRQERRRKYKEEEERKARRKAHYEKKIQQTKAKAAAKKKMKAVEDAETKVESPKKPEPKTIFGKVIRWLVDAS